MAPVIFERSTLMCLIVRGVGMGGGGIIKWGGVNLGRMPFMAKQNRLYVKIIQLQTFCFIHKYYNVKKRR